MRIGLAILPTAETIDVAVLVQRAEALGFESLWAPEQNVLPVKTERPVPRLWGDIVDPLILLARASAMSTTIKLGTAVSVIPERDPLILAKQVATLDRYSGGRLLFGIGVGSGREQAQIMGSDFPHRWTQAKEAVLAMKSLWTDEVSEFHGGTTTSRRSTASQSRPSSHIRRCCSVAKRATCSSGLSRGAMAGFPLT